MDSSRSTRSSVPSATRRSRSSTRGRRKSRSWWSRATCCEVTMAEPERGPERPVRFETLSGLPIEPLYTPESLREWSADERLGRPGEYPLTRGVYPTMHRGRLWTMRMFAGFGRPEETNRRFRFLLEQGQTGLSTAFDLPTLYGYDADHPLFTGEFGHCGVGMSSLADRHRLFDG